MDKLMNIKKMPFVLLICLFLLLYGCGGGAAVVIDYGDAESFEAALNEGKNLEGKVIQFVVREFHPDSAFGYNMWAGEHLNFVSSNNPDIKENDVVIVKVTKVQNILGSWMISYEKVKNAVIGEDTITYSESEKGMTENENTAADEPVNENTEKAEDREDAESSENTYEHNEYYDIVEMGAYKNSIGSIFVVHKVLAKKDVLVSGTLLAYDPDGNVIGKGTDDITLTEGQYNFFCYYFDSDITNAKFQANANAKQDSFMTGERNAVEMVQYNQSGNDLYITFRQLTDEIGSFAKFKLLFYKDDSIVSTEDGYFSIYAENLNGKDSTDVAEIWVYGIDYDRVEYVFEP